jgi:predicted GIY-YIG superfamily endonuclease
MSKSWFCYIVRCNDESFYVGIARDVPERIKRHNWGVGPAYTAKRRPVELVWSESCQDSEAARRREREIKGWSRSKKLALIKESAEAVFGGVEGRPPACPEDAKRPKGREQ